MVRCRPTVVQDRSRSSKLVPIICDFLLVLLFNNYVSVFHRFRDIRLNNNLLVENFCFFAVFTHLSLVWSHRKEVPWDICMKVISKIESLSYVVFTWYRLVSDRQSPPPLSMSYSSTAERYNNHKNTNCNFTCIDLNSILARLLKWRYLPNKW